MNFSFFYIYIKVIGIIRYEGKSSVRENGVDVHFVLFDWLDSSIVEALDYPFKSNVLHFFINFPQLYDLFGLFSSQQAWLELR